jgi:hypothetical protein
VQDGGARPRHAVEDQQPQRPARHVHPVPHRIRPQQAGRLLRPEDVHQRGVVHGVHVLRVERMPDSARPARSARPRRAAAGPP